MVKDIFDEIMDDIQEYSKNIAKFTAIEIREELAFTVYDAIEKFYDSYEPEYYRRHYDNFMKKSYKKYYKNNHDTTFTGGVILSPELMDDIYRADKEFVFNLVYAGYHGLDSWSSAEEPTSWGERMQPSPLDLIESKYKEILRDPNKYSDAAEKKARKLRKF